MIAILEKWISCWGTGDGTDAVRKLGKELEAGKVLPWSIPCATRHPYQC